MGTELCLFCDNPADSAEHIFPDWLNKYITLAPADPPITVTLMGLDGREARYRSRKVAAVRHRCVCQKCNSGWMSELENEVKPFLEKAVPGQRVHLDPYGSIDIAVWAVMKAYVLEHYGGIAESSRKERARLRKDHVPPQNAGVILAHYGPGRRSMATVLHVPNAQTPITLASLVIGAFAVKVGFVRRKGRGGRGYGQPPVLRDENDPQAIPIFGWVSWPPPEPIPDYEALDAWTRRASRES